MGVLINLTGQRFGRLLVIERAGSRNREALWHCKCNCGNEIYSRGASLRNGLSQSCGCLQKEIASNSHFAKTHGGSSERLYSVWRGMIDRTTLPSHNRFEHYGGRGISVCDEWKHSYEKFRTWALKNGYDPSAKRGECTIDRIDVNGDYEPFNCRWVDMKHQAKNKQLKEGAF